MTVRVFAFAAAVLPLIALYSNRGMVIVLAVCGLAALWDARRMPEWWRGAWWRGACSAPVLVLGLLLAWGAASWLWEATGGMALPKALALAALALGGLVLVVVTPTFAPPERQRLLCWGVAGMLAASAVVGLDVVLDLALSRRLASLSHGFVIPDITFLPTKFKAGATVSLVWSMALAAGAIAARRPLWAVAVVGAAIGLNVVAHSFAGVVAVPACLAAAVLVRLMPRAGLIGLGAILAALLVAAPFAAIRFPPSKVLADTYAGLPNSAIHRTVIWQFVAGKAIERPIVGWGLDASRELPGGDANVPVFLHHPWGYTESMLQPVLPLHPHNAALQLWVELGGVGAVLAAGLLASLLWSLRRYPPTIGAALAATVVAGVVVGSISFGIWQSWWQSLLWLTVALAATLSVPSDSRQA